MTVRDDIEAERGMLADSLEAVGPKARAGCGDWTAFDVAAHVLAAERAAGILAFCVRALAARGVQFRPKSSVVDSVISRERRDGYPALISRLRRRAPGLLLTPPVAASTLFEVWMHHDDLTAANGLMHPTPEHLVAAIPPLVRYHANRLPNARLLLRTPDDHERAFGADAGSTAILTGSAADLVRWLAGRCPSAPLDIDADEEVARELRAFVGQI